MWHGTSPDPGQLRSLTQKFSEKELFRSAQPLTVRLRGVMVRQDYEWALAGSNDLMIVTKFQLGNEPPVERLHFLERNVDLGWHDDFFNGIIFSTRDFGGERLTIRLQVYDIDNISDRVVKSVRGLTEQAAALFPQLAPFAGLVDFAAGPLVDLVNNLDDHDKILDDRVTLEVADPGTGHKLLQPGYVVYSKDSIGTDDSLGNDLRIRDTDDVEYTKTGYAVLELMREELEDRQYEINQKAAKLIAEIQGKGQTGTPALSFLQDTLQSYDNFKKFQRAHDLQSKESLTESEKRLLEDLKSIEAIRPYLVDR